MDHPAKVVQWLLMVTLVSMCHAQQCTPSSCPTAAKFAFNPSNHSNNDYFYLGGLFAIHEKGATPYQCGQLRKNGVQLLEAFVWAVKTFNARNPDVLTKVNIGSFAFDTCQSTDVIMQHLLNLETCVVAYGKPVVSPDRVYSFVGLETAAEAKTVVPVLESMQKTIISPQLSNSDVSVNMSYLLKAYPSETEEVSALASISSLRGYKYVQVVYGREQNYKSHFAILQNKLDQMGSCIVYHRQMPSRNSLDYFDQMDSLMQDLLMSSSARAVVLLLSTGEVTEVLLAATRNKVRGQLTWIAMTSWGTTENIVQGMEEIAEGAITLSLDPYKAGLDTFKAFWEDRKPEANEYNPWFVEYWEEIFQCNIPTSGNNKYSKDCDPSLQKLTSNSIDENIAYVIKAVDAIGFGIETARKNKCPGSDSLCSGFRNAPNKWGVIHSSIRQVQHPGITFDVDTGEATDTRYLIHNYRSKYGPCQSHCYQNIGYYKKITGLAQLQLPAFEYNIIGKKLPAKVNSTCPSSPCYQCEEVATTISSQTSVVTYGQLSTEQPQTSSEETRPLKLRDGLWAIVLIILAGLGVLFVILFEIYLMSKMIGTVFVKHWRTTWLGQLLLLSVLLCFLTVFVFVFEPTVVTCTLTRLGVGCSSALCFTIMLVKLMVIMSSKNIGYLKGIYQMLMLLFAWGVQIAVDIEWLILQKPGIVQDENGHMTCSEGFTPHVLSLSYVMVLILVCTFIAIKSHGIITNHREGIFIGLCAGFSIPIWIAWILVGMLNGNNEYKDPAIAYGLLFTALLILFVMFLPKVRQLNTMGVEGIYAEDDVPEGYAPSILPPGSVIAGSVAYTSPPSYKSNKAGSTLMLNHINEDLYTPPAAKPVHYESNAGALYLRHPGAPINIATGHASVRGTPNLYTVRPRPDSMYATASRVLRRTNDLTGRPPSAVEGRKAVSEINWYPQNNYGTTRSSRSNRSVHSYRSGGSGTLKVGRSIQDLGSL